MLPSSCILPLSPLCICITAAVAATVPCRELSDAQAHQGDESWVAQSGMYQLAQKQLSEAAAQLEARGKALAALQRDNDELRRQFETKQSKEEVGVRIALFWNFCPLACCQNVSVC